MPPIFPSKLLFRPLPRVLGQASNSSRSSVLYIASRRKSASSSSFSQSSICVRCDRRLRMLYSTSSSPFSSSLAKGADISHNDNGTKSPATAEHTRPPPDPSLPSAAESRRHPLSARFSTVMDNLQSRALAASATLNSLTGYDAIEAIKRRNAALETEAAQAQARLRTARTAHKTLAARRAASQREVAALLARKDSWTPADLERFTALYRDDHALDGQVAAAAVELADAEARDAKIANELNTGILRRYHEEQIWSDRIRRASTWGTWGLMAVNVVLFLAFQFVAEPWRRKRLVRAVADAEREAWTEVRAEVQLLKAAVAAVDRREYEGRVAASERNVRTRLPVSLADTASKPASPWKMIILNPSQWASALLDLCSERQVGLRMRDATAIAVEGAVAGAAIACGVAFLVLRRA